MVTRAEIIRIIENIFSSLASHKIPRAEIRYQKIIDLNNGIFELKMIGWRGERRVSEQDRAPWRG